jgi:anti-sigma factor RsiW
MRCDTFTELVCLFVDGELAAERQNDMFRHLGECLECRSFLQGLLKIREIQHREQVTFPAEIDRVVLNAVNAQKPTRVVSLWRKSISLPVPIAVAAAILVIVTGVLASSLLLPSEQARRQSTPNTYVQSEIPTANVIYVLPEVLVVADSSTVSNNDSGK